MPFLRPQSIPAGRVPYLVCLPDTAEWRTQLWGAISNLMDVFRWEGSSPLSDSEIQSVWVEVLNSFTRAGMLMAGIVILNAGGTVPNGWLLCDGSSLATADYPDLFAAIGYQFGGSGASFNLPDLRDRFPVGAGSTYSLGSTGGSNSVTLSTSDMPNHDHSVHTHLEGLAVAPGELPVTLPSIIAGTTGSTGSGNAHENRPPYFGLSFIICTGDLC